MVTFIDLGLIELAFELGFNASVTGRSGSYQLQLC